MGVTIFAFQVNVPRLVRQDHTVGDPSADSGPDLPDSSHSPEATVLSAWRRQARRNVFRVERALTTDLLGTALCYYAVTPDGVFASGSVRALCRHLGRVTINPVALAESLSFGFTLRDETIVREIRSIPPHSTLGPDGTLAHLGGPRATSAIADAAVAVERMRELLAAIIAQEEPRHAVHLVGFTGGRDSRILAALPRSSPDRWHWLCVSGLDDAEARGSLAHAECLGLGRFYWTEWKADFLDGGTGEPRHRVSADLADGIGAVSDFTLLRSAFERHRATALGDRGDADLALWTGAFADGLIAGTWLQPPARTIWDALSPRTAHLPAVLGADALGAFTDQSSWYRTNPFEVDATDDNVGRLIRMLTRGRSYICRSLASFDEVCSAQVNPYLHPALVALGLEVDPRLLGADALRSGVLAALGPDLDGPSAFGYRAPRYADAVLGALAAEAATCAPLTRVIRPELHAALCEGRFPELDPAAPPPSTNGPTYRVHDGEPGAIVRSLRDYEHLLTYASFLNLLADDGVVIG